MKKFSAFVIIISLAGLVAWYGLIGHSRSTGGQPGRRQPPATPVVVETMTHRSIGDIHTFSGSIESRTQFVVAPKIAGRLEHLAVRIGDRVVPGQLLAVLEDAEYQRQVEQARAELAVARAGLEESQQLQAMARREFARTEELHTTRIASESELDAARTELSRQNARHRVAAAQVDQKVAALHSAELRLAFTRIHVPEHLSNGMLVVAERFTDAGSLLNINSPIVSVVDLASLLAVIHITEKAYFRIVLGQPARITSDGIPGRVFVGQVARLAPLLKSASRKARVEIELENTEGLLKPGMFSRVEIEFARREDVPAVRLEALVHQNGREGVFVADRSKHQAVFVPLHLGIRDTGHAEVTGIAADVSEAEERRAPEDLPQNDLKPLLSYPVVIAGQHLLHDGAAILITRMDGQPFSNGDAPTPAKGTGRTP